MRVHVCCDTCLQAGHTHGVLGVWHGLWYIPRVQSQGFYNDVILFQLQEDNQLVNAMAISTKIPLMENLDLLTQMILRVSMLLMVIHISKLLCLLYKGTLMPLSTYLLFKSHQNCTVNALSVLKPFQWSAPIQPLINIKC